MPLEDRWIPVRQFIEEERLGLDDLFRLADAKRLPPHSWLGKTCLIDRSRIFSWRQILQLEGIE